MEEGTNLTVKVGGIVKSGVVAYLDGIRGFIPASRLSLNYVEEDALNDWLGKELEVRVINADAENKRLVLSAREILREKADEERKAKVSNVQVGLVTEGTVETIKPYGAFINLGNGLSGLLHVSQICRKTYQNHGQCSEPKVYCKSQDHCDQRRKTESEHESPERCSRRRSRRRDFRTSGDRSRYHKSWLPVQKH